MPAYIVFTRESTSNEQELKTYSALAFPTLKDRAVKPLAFYGAVDVLEGAGFEGAVIFEFPTVADARDWYDSPAYQAAAKHRKAGSNYRVFIVDGVAQP